MAKDELKLDIDSLNFAVEKSMRYHQRRRGYYDAWHKLFMFLIILSGSAAFAELPLFQDADSAAFNIFGALVAGIAAIDLVWGLSHRARDHEMLFRRFSELAVKIRTEEGTETSCKEWLNERISIETDEPPIYWALEADCDNEVRRAWDRDEELVKIDRWFRWTMHLFKHSTREFKLVSRVA